MIGVDSGDSTGVFALRDAAWIWRYQGKPSVVLRELDLWLRCYVSTYPGDDVAIACERFQASGQRGARTHQPTAQNVIGQVESIAAAYDCHFMLQSPADAKRFFTNERLRRHDLYTCAADVNAPDARDVNDAARHAVLYLAREHATVFERLLGLSP